MCVCVSVSVCVCARAIPTLFIGVEVWGNSMRGFVSSIIFISGVCLNVSTVEPVKVEHEA